MTPASSAPINNQRHLTGNVLFVLLIVLLTRIPLLLPGYGPDADSWLVAHSSKQLWTTGHYTPSRLPGYPLHEIVSAPMVSLGGPLLSNTATLVVSLLVMALWWKISHRFTPVPRVAFASMAFAPLFWNASVVTMDYVWSLLFILLAFWSAWEGKSTVAGIYLGIATGFRLANGIALFPLALFVQLQQMQPRTMIRLCMATVVTAIVCYVPLLLTYGPIGWAERTIGEMSDVHPALARRLQSFTYRSVYAVGPLAMTVILSIVAKRHRLLGRQLEARDPLTILSLAMIAAFLLLFLALPIERAYLLPALPFLILLMTRIARRREAVALLVALISLAFVNPDIAAHREGDPVFQPAIRWGRLVELWNERRDVLEGRRIIAAYSYSPHSIVLTGGDVTFWFENSLVTPDTPAAWMNSDRVVTRSLMLPDVRFVASVDTAELRSARENGFAVVCPEPARKYVERLAGYRPEDHGIRIIPLQPEN